MFEIKGDGELLLIEQILTGADDQPKPTPIFKNTSSRDIVLRNILILEGQAYVNTGSGKLYLEDFSATSLRYWGGSAQPVASAIPQFDFGGQTVWARQLNPEQKDLNILNDGGSLWILGMKNEEDGTQIKTINGGKTELLGGVLMPLDVDVGSSPGYIVENSEFSAVIAGHNRAELPKPYANPAPNFEIIVRESQAGITRDLLDGDVALRRTDPNNQGDTPPVLALYSSLRSGLPYWRLENFGSDAGQPFAADLADPDFDGLSNFYEYAFGSDPLSKLSKISPSFDFSGDSVQVSFPRMRSDLNYSVYVTEDLENWQELLHLPVELGDIQTVIDTELISDRPRRFMRVSISR